jgi:hypothetical protein
VTTSGTVSTTTFNTRKVIELAYRGCRIPPQKLGPERVQTALDLLFLRLSSMANKGVALWAVTKEILPIYTNTPSISLPVGSVDLLNCNLRQLQRVAGTYSSSSGTAANAFDGDLSTACTETAANGYIQAQFDSATLVSNFGLMPNATGTWSISLQGSNDGTSFTTFWSDTAFAAVDGQWQWWDVEGMANWSYIRLQAAGGTTLDVTELYLGNSPSEIPCAPLNRDQYSDLPNKFFAGRPVQFWYDKQRTQPIVTVWPAPGSEFTFYQLVCYVHRYVQDVGTMVQEVEVPQSWYHALVARLKGDIALTDEEVDPGLVATLDSVGDREWRAAWDGQSDGSPSYIMPNIGPYTR